MSIICAKHFLSLTQRTADSLNLLQGFWERDDVRRQEDYRTIHRTFDSWYFGFGSPAVAGFLELVADDTGGTTLDTSMHGLIKEQISDLMRISFTGPTAEIRSVAQELLQDLKSKKGFYIPPVQLLSPSCYLSPGDMPHLQCLREEPTEDENMFTTYALFREHWFQWGRLENYVCLMGFHPEYLESYMKLQAHLFRADLPIPYPDRHYLAVLAAAEQRCVYLVLLFARQFLASGGDPTWLRGILHGPIKWRQLARVNCDLAGQPWNLTADCIHHLTHGGDTRSCDEILSLSELTHAIAIFTHVHSLACFVLACGIRSEIDQLDVFYTEPNEPHAPNGTSGQVAAKPTTDNARSHDIGNLDPPEGIHCTCSNCSTEFVPLSTASTGDAPPRTPLSSACKFPADELLKILQEEERSWEELDEDTVMGQFIHTTERNKDLDSIPSFASRARASELMSRLNRHGAIGRFLQFPDSGYENFANPPFHGMEYCWKEEGYPFADRLCTDLGTLLDEKFRNTYDLTYNTLSHITNVDTTLYRRTIWNFVQSLFGIYHDDFRYNCIDRLLDCSQRSFLKLCATCPASLNPEDHRLDHIFPALSPSEVVHIILMTVEARQQACVLYALRAASDCQARSYR